MESISYHLADLTSTSFYLTGILLEIEKKKHTIIKLQPTSCRVFESVCAILPNKVSTRAARIVVLYHWQVCCLVFVGGDSSICWKERKDMFWHLFVHIMCLLTLVVDMGKTTPINGVLILSVTIWYIESSRKKPITPSIVKIIVNFSTHTIFMSVSSLGSCVCVRLEF